MGTASVKDMVKGEFRSNLPGGGQRYIIVGVAGQLDGSGQAAPSRDGSREARERVQPRCDIRKPRAVHRQRHRPLVFPERPGRCPPVRDDPGQPQPVRSHSCFSHGHISAGTVRQDDPAACAEGIHRGSNSWDARPVDGIPDVGHAHAAHGDHRSADVKGRTGGGLPRGHRRDGVSCPR
ncbi:hypothetical protein SDC9_42083 [bioreactor metagenome]|uniref:Uncharacterized protein n=1 Tax=bioreactor metagenome TaxID=1076179 RepID=A0A644VXP0_9ZZZZ